MLLHLFQTTDFSGVPTLLARLGMGTVLLILIPYSIAAVLDTISWRRLLSMGVRRFSFLRIFRIRTATEAVVITVPLGSIISDPLKSWMLKREIGLGLSSSAASIVLRKTFLGFCQGLLALSIAAFSLLRPASIASAGFSTSLIWTLFGAAFGIVVLYGTALGLLCNRSFIDRFHRWLARLPFPRIGRWFGEKEPQFREFNAHLRSFSFQSVLTFIALYTFIWLTESIETYMILVLLGAHMTFPEAFLMEAACVLMRTLMPMVPGGIGVQDTGYVSILTTAGNSDSLAAAFLVLKRFREVLWAIVGYALLATSRKKALAPDRSSEPLLAMASEP